jgi:hypothetical protein
MRVSNHARPWRSVLVPPSLRMPKGFGIAPRWALVAATLSAFLVSWAITRRVSAETDRVPSQGTLVSDGARKIAGVHGAQYQLPGGAIVTLAPGSEATIIAKPQLLILTGGKRTPTYSVYLKSGRLDANIPRSATSAILVASPADVRVVCEKGLSVVSAANRSSFVWTEKYPLLVSQKERLSRLKPGPVRKYTANAPPVDYDSAKAPRWLTGRRIWLAMPDQVKITDFSWSTVAEAERYRVELREDATGTLIAESDQKETTLHELLPMLSPGNYQLVVRALDVNNMPGNLSAPLLVQVVGVDVPPGARLQPGGRIEISESQTIQFRNADGLSLKRANEHTLRPASEPIGIVNGNPTPLLIQGSDGSDACLVWLLPKKSPVTAYVGPKWAVWPHESVDLEVRWTDASGRRLPDDVKPAVIVYVGLEAVDVKWNKNGDLWRAHLNPLPGQGPCVVRLEIRDEGGAILARDFVEVQRRKEHPYRYWATSANLTNPTTQ